MGLKWFESDEKTFYARAVVFQVVVFLEVLLTRCWEHMDRKDWAHAISIRL